MQLLLYAIFSPGTPLLACCRSPPLAEMPTAPKQTCTLQRIACPVHPAVWLRLPGRSLPVWERRLLRLLPLEGEHGPPSWGTWAPSRCVVSMWDGLQYSCCFQQGG